MCAGMSFESVACNGGTLFAGAIKLAHWIEPFSHLASRQSTVVSFLHLVFSLCACLWEMYGSDLNTEERSFIQAFTEVISVKRNDLSSVFLFHYQIKRSFSVLSRQIKQFENTTPLYQNSLKTKQWIDSLENELIMKVLVAAHILTDEQQTWLAGSEPAEQHEAVPGQAASSPWW